MKAVIDACVLYPTVLREITIGLARAGRITPIWSARLMEEWARTAARRGAPVDEALARGDIAALSAAFPEAVVPPDPAQEARLWLPDRGDIHVLATAITGGADTILTLNLRDFPRSELLPHGLCAIHPDAAFYQMWLDAPQDVSQIVQSVHGTAEHLSGEALEVRGLLKRARLPRLAKALG
jgi:predicted nucleic acid-binding protein